MIKQYNYIIIGAGCAGLSLLMRMLDNNADAKVLLLDKTGKNTNDRTWCFWEKKAGYFDDIVYRKWNDLSFCDESGYKHLAMEEYSYKMIRGIDFYSYCFNRIQQSPGVEFQITDIQSAEVTGNRCRIKAGSDTIEAEAEFVFNSIPGKATPDIRAIALLQHFKGWIIRTEGNSNNIKPCLMDFRIDQSPGIAFVYTLPVDETSVLIEYTVFSSTVLPGEKYDNALKGYIENTLGIKTYTLEHTEFGIIPMTNQRFPFYKNGMYYIGSAGGQTKPSSGYTFSFIQKQSECIARQLSTCVPSLRKCNTNKARFLLYDSILLKILHDDIMPGSEIFKRLFHRLPACIIFKFLDNETTLSEEIKILNAMPSKIFLPVAIKQMINQLRN
ncbi:MAG: lycopene cyclase family protein [Agriterribacter sp.]